MPTLRAIPLIAQYRKTRSVPQIYASPGRCCASRVLPSYFPLPGRGRHSSAGGAQDCERESVTFKSAAIVMLGGGCDAVRLPRLAS